MDTNLLSHVARLSDYDLLAQVKDLAQHEREATVALVVYLAELDERRLYLAEGYPSLFKYCTDVLHLSEHATYNRIQAARAVRRFPVLLEHLTAGRVNLFAVRLLAPHLTPGNHCDVLSLAQHKSQREVEELVARLRPQPAVPDVIRKLPTLTQAASETPALPVAFHDATGGPLGGDALQSAVPLSEMAAQLAAAAPTPARRAMVSPLAPERYKIQFTASAALREKLREAQALLRHQIPDGDLEKVFDRALEALLAHLRKQKLSATDRPRNRSHNSDTAFGAATGSGPRSRHIPAAVKRAVWKRDDGRCAFVSAGGRRCGDKGFVEFHHVMPYASWGQPTTDNIELRCRAHNGYEAERHFARWATAVREDPAVYALQAVTVNATTVRGAQSANSFGNELELITHGRRFSGPSVLGATRRRARVYRAASTVGTGPGPPPGRRTARLLCRVSPGLPSYPGARQQSGRPLWRTAGEPGQRFQGRKRGAAAPGKTRRPLRQIARWSKKPHWFCRSPPVPRPS